MKERITYLIGILLIVCLILAGCNRSTANEFSNPEGTPDETPEENTANMTAALASVKTLDITFAARDSQFDGQEIKGGQVAIVDSTIKTVEAVDITEKFAAGEDLGVYVGLPVLVKGVTIGAQDLEKDTSQYLYFAIGEKQGYV